MKGPLAAGSAEEWYVQKLRISRIPCRDGGSSNEHILYSHILIFYNKQHIFRVLRDFKIRRQIQFQLVAERRVKIKETNFI